mgnify:CR=1 FL=1
MSAPRIRANYDELDKAGQMFAQEQAALQKMLAELQGRLDMLQGGDWVGRAATAFYGEMNGDVLPTIKRLIRAMDRAATVARALRTRIQQAEADAARVLNGQSAAGGGADSGSAGGGGTAGGGASGGGSSGGGTAGGGASGGGSGGGTPGVDPRLKPVQDKIDAGDKQGAIDEAIKQYGLGLKDVKGTPQYDSSTSGEGATSPDGSVTIGDAAFSSPGWLASSVGHEGLHATQAAEGRWYTDDEGTALNEVECYDWELANARQNGLSTTEIAELQSRRQAHYDALSDTVKKRVDKGDYTLP